MQNFGETGSWIDSTVRNQSPPWTPRFFQWIVPVCVGLGRTTLAWHELWFGYGRDRAEAGSIRYGWYRRQTFSPNAIPDRHVPTPS